MPRPGDRDRDRDRDRGDRRDRRDRDDTRRKYTKFRKDNRCRFCRDKVAVVDYKDVGVLVKLCTGPHPKPKPGSRISASRFTGVAALRSPTCMRGIWREPSIWWLIVGRPAGSTMWGRTRLRASGRSLRCAQRLSEKSWTRCLTLLPSGWARMGATG